MNGGSKMKLIALYLDEAIDRKIVKNDAETAARLGIARATVSRWRAGEKAPGDEEAIALAYLLQKHPEELLMECAATRTKSPEARRVFERLAKQFAVAASVATAMIISGFCLTYSPQTQAQPMFEAFRLFIM
jgi:transcriptional regulator with XRE-family HTH domain